MTARRNISLPPAYDDLLKRRADGPPRLGRSQAVCQFIDEAHGNARRLRHGLRQPLSTIVLICAELRQQTRRQPDALRSVDEIQDAVHQAEQLLAQLGTS